MNTSKERALLAERIAKHADLNTNVVLRVLYAVQDLGMHIVPGGTAIEFDKGEPVVRTPPASGKPPVGTQLPKGAEAG